MSDTPRLPAPLAGAELPLAVKRHDKRVRERFWPAFWRTAGKIPFSEELAAAFYCARDARTPSRVKAVLLGALAYFVAPTGMLPDFVAGLGFTVDATVLATAMGLVGAHVKERHRMRARRLLDHPNPPPEDDEADLARPGR
ncbi:MAG: DUF1232 domain-containing protein [Caulobacterales bacterium]|nr:DUF1232 domain-containing protein [Caulobacterales bacterium]